MLAFSPHLRAPTPLYHPLSFLLQWQLWVHECTCIGTSIVSSQLTEVPGVDHQNAAVSSPADGQSCILTGT